MAPASDLTELAEAEYEVTKAVDEADAFCLYGTKRYLDLYDH